MQLDLILGSLKKAFETEKSLQLLKSRFFEINPPQNDEIIINPHVEEITTIIRESPSISLEDDINITILSNTEISNEENIVDEIKIFDHADSPVEERNDAFDQISEAVDDLIQIELTQIENQIEDEATQGGQKIVADSILVDPSQLPVLSGNGMDDPYDVENQIQILMDQIAKSINDINELLNKRKNLTDRYEEEYGKVSSQRNEKLQRFDEQITKLKQKHNNDQNALTLKRNQIHSQLQQMNKLYQTRYMLPIGVSLSIILLLVVTSIFVLPGIITIDQIIVAILGSIIAVILLGILIIGAIRWKNQQDISSNLAIQIINIDQEIRNDITEFQNIHKLYEKLREDDEISFDNALHEARNGYSNQLNQISNEQNRISQNCSNHLIPKCEELNNHLINFHQKTLNNWHPDWAQPSWTAIDVDDFVTKSSIENRGIKIGNLFSAEISNQIPAILDPIGNHKHIFIQGGNPDKRADLLRSICTRLLVSFPVGLARVVLIDSIDQGKTLTLFATKLHEDLRGTKVHDVEQEIADEILKLRSKITQINHHVLVEHNSIDSYNFSNPDIPTPYQFLIISNFPNGFTNQSLKALQDILRNGPQAGVYVIASVSDQLPDSRDFKIESYIANNYLLSIKEDQRLQWNSEYLSNYKVTPDSIPHSFDLGGLLHKIADAYRKKPLVINYERIDHYLPTLWSKTTIDELKAPVGFTFGGKLHEIEFNDQYVHGLVGGRTGSGKTIFLHNVICGLSQLYPPDELQLYLLDFKGTEFNVYAKNHLPHAKVVAVDCDPELGLDVIRNLTEEMEKRRKLFDEADVEDIRHYREKGYSLARILLIIDEIQMLTQISDDLKLVKQVENSLIELLKLGRSNGIHVLIGTQSPSNVLSNQMLQQIAIRICLVADQQVSRLVLGEMNESASGLQRQGEAVYNDHNGDSNHDVFIRTALLEKEMIVSILGDMQRKPASLEDGLSKSMFYFDGKKRGKLTENTHIMEAINDAVRYNQISDAIIPLGNAIGPKSDTSIFFTRTIYSNLLIVGGVPEKLHSLVTTSLLSLCIQIPPELLTCYLIDLCHAETNLVGHLRKNFHSMPQEFQFANNPTSGATLINEVFSDLNIRKDMMKKSQFKELSIVLVIFSMENFTETRGQDKYTKTETRKQLEEIIRDGPSVGIHTIVSTQTLSKGEIISSDGFGMRICYQISEDDSRALLDVDTGTKLRSDRCILRMREWPYGKTEKFKPFLPPTTKEIQEIQQAAYERAASK